jgi:hypothetical protein
MLEDRAETNYKIVILKLSLELLSTTTVQRLEQMSEWNHNYLVSHLATCGNHVVAGDHISSVSLLSVDDGGIVKTVAKNHGPLWPVAVDMFDQHSIVGANVSIAGIHGWMIHQYLSLFCFRTHSIYSVSLCVNMHQEVCSIKMARGILGRS